jgi:general bacterial porin, GBP family
MTKRITLLAALAGLATGAFAQQTPTVTIFGLVDLGVHHLRSGDNSPLKGQNLTRLSDGVVYGPGSRWGIRVSEDLGSGLTVGAVLESGFSADTGALGQGGRAFGRQSFISVASKSVGELRLGRQYILHDETQAFTNPAGNTTVLNPGGIYTLSTGTFPLFIDAPRVDNALHYLSPIFGGVRVQGMVALSEGTQDRYQGLKASYAQGPLNVAAVYEQSKAVTGVSASGSSTVNKIFEAGANYDFGAFKLFGGVQRGKDLTTGLGTQIGTLSFPGLTGAATEVKAWNLGASMPLGVATVMANVTRSSFSNATGQEVSVGRYGLGASYAFSKQTLVYSAFAIAAGDLKDHIVEKQIFQVGLRKAF